MIEIQVKYFAAIREIMGTGETTMKIPPGTTIDAFLRLLAGRHSEIGKWTPYLRVAVNKAYADAATVIAAGDELAVIPPVSGG